ncbi:HNH endonuclease signature motif containing protein [Modestobacter marinus]|uniref:HNH endonuclease signature motif containing protein n=1 Tax=Modestobacter marinus TaxID=477641 RepID=UPI001C95CB73|nr:HNH endonuclease signature motif containing protein [Modestobacter marinus]
MRWRERTAAALIAVDDAAADRRRKRAERHADVTVRPAAEGMAQLVADLPGPVAAACRKAVDGYARLARKTGDERPIGQLRSLVLAELVLRPWDTSREPVTAHLTVLAPLPALDARRPAGPGRGAGAGGGEGGAGLSVPTDADPASVDGAPITAGQLRELLERLDALCPGGLRAPPGGTREFALTNPGSGALRATVTRAELQRLGRRGCPAHPGGACGCAVLDRPPPVDRYTPTPAQRRFLRARDRWCRHPGCRRPAGRTDCANLCCLCRRHHRLKTHAPGWRFAVRCDGVLTGTTSSGVTRTTRPPGSASVQGPDASLRAVGGTGVLQPPPY